MPGQKNRTINRRALIKTAGLAAVGAALGASKASASFDGLIEGMKRDAKTAPVKAIPLKPGFTVIENVGGNITVFSGSGVTLLVDSGISEQNPQISEAIRALDVPPIREVINTHWHFDHSSGNPWFHEDGARLTAHSNTLKHLLVPTTVTPWRYTFQPIPVAGRPTNLLQGNNILNVGGESLSVLHVEHGHTDGDLMVHFEHGDVLSTGDIFWNGHYPFVDNEAGGSIDGMILGAQHALALSTSKTHIVPGHGSIASKDELKQYAEMLLEIRGNVADLKKQGRSLTETVLARPTAKFDAKYGDYAVAPDDFVALVYKGV